MKIDAGVVGIALNALEGLMLHGSRFHCECKTRASSIS
jgi:hypothetical protein